MGYWSTIGFILFSLLGLLERKAVNGDWKTAKEKQSQLYTTTWYPLGDGSFWDGFTGQFVISQLCTSYFPYCYDNIISYQQLQGRFILGSWFAGIINPCVGSQSIGARAIYSQEEEREEGRCSVCFCLLVQSRILAHGWCCPHIG